MPCNGITHQDTMDSIVKNTNLPKLLVVDDQAINIQILAEIFEDGYEVYMATSGTEALQVCAAHHPDLILLDVAMPDMDGHEVCRRLKSDPATEDIPIIFVTAHNNPEEEAEGLKLGAVDFISKPVNAVVVQARVKTHLTLKHQSDLLRSLAFVDGLTGIANRRHFEASLVVEWRQAARKSVPLSVIMIDVDHFKAYNDHYGHAGGDAVLQQVAAAIQRCMGRAHDLAARYGGEEFVCLLPDCDLEGAGVKAEEIRAAVAALELAHAASQTGKTLSISVGASSGIPRDDLTAVQLVVLADEQLYLAKTSGRNRCCVGQFGGSTPVHDRQPSSPKSGRSA